MTDIVKADIASAPVMREVTAFSSGQNARKVTIQSNATTLAELKEDFDKAGIKYSGMTMVERETKNTLILPEAVLPSRPFLVYLMPEKTKSGLSEEQVDALPYKECRNFIQQAIIADGESTKEYFNSGKNYTTKTTDEMRELIKEYNGSFKDKFVEGSVPVPIGKPAKPVKEKKESKKEKPAVKTPAPVKEKNVADVVKTVVDAKSAREQAASDTVQELTDLQRAVKAEDLVGGITDPRVPTAMKQNARQAIQNIKTTLSSNTSAGEDDELKRELAALNSSYKRATGSR